MERIIFIKEYDYSNELCIKKAKTFITNDKKFKFHYYTISDIDGCESTMILESSNNDIDNQWPVFTKSSFKKTLEELKNWQQEHSNEILYYRNKALRPDLILFYDEIAALLTIEKDILNNFYKIEPLSLQLLCKININHFPYLNINLLPNSIINSLSYL